MSIDHIPYDCFLLVSFGGPEGPDDVMPFLENVLRGKNVPRERMLEVAEHYYHFGGVSPINQQNRELLAAIETQIKSAGLNLPVYWGNRNWHPMFADTLRQMRDDGRKSAIAFFTSTFSCYSGCRQYRENIMAAQAEVGSDAPRVEKLRMGFNHPGFIEPIAENVAAAIRSIDGGSDVKVLFTAHSIPDGMAQNCSYERQLRESCRLIGERLNLTNWQLVYQSRSGPPQQPWLEPDVCDEIERLHREESITKLVIMPVGFISDHMEVLYDLDSEAADLCQKLGIQMARAKTVGTHPRFVQMVVELIQERMGLTNQKLALGDLGPWHDVCPENCCLYTPARPMRPATT